MCFLAISIANATVVVVKVSNFQFSPANPTVTVGDVIEFSFTEGFHNVSSRNIANALPAGAAEIYSGAASSSNPRTFDYTVTVAGTYKYICEIHADAASFTGMVATFTATANLPVLFKDFEITATTDKKPLLNWSTLTEQNVDYFTVRRSSDGLTYENLAKISAVGNSTTLQNYSFIDNTISTKDRYVYYALTVTDKDGKLTYSPVKTFNNPSAVANKIVVSAGPNPITRPGQLMMQFNADKEGTLLLNIYNSVGKLVVQQKMSAFIGLNNGHVHVCDLAAGTYTLQFLLNGAKESRKVIVQ